MAVGPFDLKAVKPCTCGGKGKLLTDRHQWTSSGIRQRCFLQDSNKLRNDIAATVNDFAAHRFA